MFDFLRSKRKELTIPAREVPVIMEQAVKEILFQLSHFCRAYETCFHADPRVHAALEGRREVWLKLREMYIDRPETEEDIRRRFMEAIMAKQTAETSDAF